MNKKFFIITFSLLAFIFLTAQTCTWAYTQQSCYNDDDCSDGYICESGICTEEENGDDLDEDIEDGTYDLSIINMDPITSPFNDDGKFEVTVDVTNEGDADVSDAKVYCGLALYDSVDEMFSYGVASVEITTIASDDTESGTCSLNVLNLNSVQEYLIDNWNGEDITYTASASVEDYDGTDETYEITGTWNTDDIIDVWYALYDDVLSFELDCTIDECISEIPNVAILEFGDDDDCRASDGAVDPECFFEEFYDQYPDDFDMLVLLHVGEDDDKKNSVSFGLFRRYVPTNIGYVDDCEAKESMASFCELLPERLRYMQTIGDVITTGAYPKDTFIHEVGHYWGVGWRQGSSSYDECFDEEWMEHIWENVHWTELFQAGEDSSTLSYYLNEVSDGDMTGIPWGPWTDNDDGTFTKTSSDYEERIFNYIDLYAMGLMTEEELADKEMYVILNPIYTEDYTYSGTRYDLTLDDFKNLLKIKEDCEGTGTEYYYIGDGTRTLNSYDGETELAESFRVGMVLIKYPEEAISNNEAYEICEAVNYEFPEHWSEATGGLSEIDLRLEEGSELPDCSELYDI